MADRSTLSSCRGVRGHGFGPLQGLLAGLSCGGDDAEGVLRADVHTSLEDALLPLSVEKEKYNEFNDLAVAAAMARVLLCPVLHVLLLYRLA